MPDIKLEESWKTVLQSEVSKEYMQVLRAFLAQEKAAGKQVYPRGREYFRAMDLTPFENVKVVILGQDPYHGPGQAHGLSFSVRPDVRIPPSLVNIYKELDADLGIPPANHGFLEHWAEQGVLLLNAVLTVEHKQAASHQGQGWEEFTDRVIRELNEQREHVVFILWGSYAQKKGRFIDESKHLVLKSVHPSPLSAYRGFFGSKPFSKANDYLVAHGQKPIDWSLPAV
ncbi:uracil-DNA glycosylase [Endozoicomonas sp. (ex Bugula neritina AB1)]|nr:uracil-DNA glycosylase [Endozoicomonas sp. (ex Bugula neritina AB1)]